MLLDQEVVLQLFHQWLLSSVWCLASELKLSDQLNVASAISTSATVCRQSSPDIANTGACCFDGLRWASVVRFLGLYVAWFVNITVLLYTYCYSWFSYFRSVLLSSLLWKCNEASNSTVVDLLVDVTLLREYGLASLDNSRIDCCSLGKTMNILG